MPRLEVELSLVVRNPASGRRYSMLERRAVELYQDDRMDVLMDMVAGLIERRVTNRMVEVERGD